MKPSSKPGLGVAIGLEFHQIVMRLEELLPGRKLNIQHTAFIDGHNRDHTVVVTSYAKDETTELQPNQWVGTDTALDDAWKKVIAKILAFVTEDGVKDSLGQE